MLSNLYVYTTVSYGPPSIHIYIYIFICRFILIYPSPKGEGASPSPISVLFPLYTMHGRQKNDSVLLQL